VADTTRTSNSPHGWTIWLTGLPASGKTTIARALQRRLRERGVDVLVLDSDALRPVIAPGAGYGEADRDGFYRQLVALAALLNREGGNVVIAATGHRRAYREAARAALPRFAEVWVRCPLAICAARDPKGLYAAAGAGGISGLPGGQLAYEPPAAPELVLDTAAESVEQLLDRLSAALPSLVGTAA
jgi:adenylylsulfate kinase